jgi:hypothetical protein
MGKESKLATAFPRKIDYQSGFMMEQASMQTREYKCADTTKIENFYDALDFPTTEELLEALETSLEQPPRLSRTTSAAVKTTSCNLAHHWQNLNGLTAEQLRKEEAGHYLASWLEDPVSHRGITVELDFLAGLVKFLMERLTLRSHELSEARHQLTEELAKFQSGPAFLTTEYLNNGK